MLSIQLLSLPALADTPWPVRLHTCLTRAGARVHGLGAEAAPATEAPFTLVLAQACELLTWLKAQGGAWNAGPLLWTGPAPSDPEAEALLAQGLSSWWPLDRWADGDAPAVELAEALRFEFARWRHQQTVQRQISQLRTQMDERKWVDRAKGLLMSTRGMAEDDAFRLLRSAAMHANLRVGEVSRSVVEASQWADAINRSGQLRMLSQRLVKLAAQRLLGVDARRARTLQHQARLRVEDNLTHLAALPPLAQGPHALTEALACVTRAWSVLGPALEQRPGLVTLLEADQHAEALLQAAEALTDALEQHGARRSLHIVNLCGRQRMRVQRLAKDALLATLPDQLPRAQALGPLLDAFEAALLELERAPLSTPDTRSLLAEARDEWLRLLRGLRSAEGEEGRSTLAGSADALLGLFERLTEAYEHSLHVIMA